MDMVTLKDENSSDNWIPRLTPEELAAKYGPYVAFNDTGATMDFDALETAAEGQTYVALYPDSETAQHVSQWTIDHGVPRAVPADELHATMFQLNRASEATWKAGPINPIIVQPDRFSIGPHQQPHRLILCMYFQDPALAKRRDAMSKVLRGRMEHAALFRMTLSYGLVSWMNKGAYAINFPLTFVREEDREP